MKTIIIHDGQLITQNDDGSMHLSSSAELRDEIETLRVAWRIRAAEWLRQKATDQDVYNERYPHIKEHSGAWRERPEACRSLADELLRAAELPAGRSPPGVLEVGASADATEVIINAPFTPDNGSGYVHFAFTPDQARNLARLLEQTAGECKSGPAAAPFGICAKCKEPITSFHNINGCPADKKK
jgi:hypothetical protein